MPVQLIQVLMFVIDVNDMMYHNPLALSVLLNEGKHSFFDNYFLACFCLLSEC